MTNKKTCYLNYYSKFYSDFLSILLQKPSKIVILICAGMKERLIPHYILCVSGTLHVGLK